MSKNDPPFPIFSPFSMQNPSFPLILTPKKPYFRPFFTPYFGHIFPQPKKKKCQITQKNVKKWPSTPHFFLHFYAKSAISAHFDTKNITFSLFLTLFWPNFSATHPQPKKKKKIQKNVNFRQKWLPNPHFFSVFYAKSANSAHFDTKKPQFLPIFTYKNCIFFHLKKKKKKKKPSNNAKFDSLTPIFFPVFYAKSAISAHFDTENIIFFLFLPIKTPQNE
jgi:hypothetical protein